jgi:hypothetical protein
MTRRAKRVTTDTDPRIDELVQTLEDDPAFAPVIRDFLARRNSGGRTFGSNGLKVRGKLFALFTQGTLVVKLPRERVTALIASKVGKPFDPGQGRLMKEWLTVTSRRASWSDLTRESYVFVSGGSR